MAAGAQTREWNGISRRTVPRFLVQAPVDVTVLRSGVPDTVPGRSVNVCERGVAAMLAGEMVPGEAVGVEVWLPLLAETLRARAMVRYQDKLRCGLEFVGLSVEQRSAIRDWARQAKVETEVTPPRKPPQGEKLPDSETGTTGGGSPGKPQKQRGPIWTLVLVLAAVAIALFWWKWNRAWGELESGLKNPSSVAAENIQAQVPAEVMEKLLVHRVEPVYPADARQANLQGVVALDIVVGRDGSVVSMRPLNGPDVLADAAMDALRWWKFEPYRINGEPAIVETTLAVEFKK